MLTIYRKKLKNRNLKDLLPFDSYFTTLLTFLPLQHIFFYPSTIIPYIRVKNFCPSKISKLAQRRTWQSRRKQGIETLRQLTVWSSGNDASKAHCECASKSESILFPVSKARKLGRLSAPS